ncbi:hypothetical protein J6590_104872 [Homalodisca vitripennis]|nr:hypothetical protein J6590_104872 [Homalodisca vitripennis]
MSLTVAEANTTSGLMSDSITRLNSSDDKGQPCQTPAPKRPEPATVPERSHTTLIEVLDDRSWLADGRRDLPGRREAPSRQTNLEYGGKNVPRRIPTPLQIACSTQLPPLLDPSRQRRSRRHTGSTKQAEAAAAEISMMAQRGGQRTPHIEHPPDDSLARRLIRRGQCVTTHTVRQDEAARGASPEVARWFTLK